MTTFDSVQDLHLSAARLRPSEDKDQVLLVVAGTSVGGFDYVHASGDKFLSVYRCTCMHRSIDLPKLRCKPIN